MENNVVPVRVAVGLGDAVAQLSLLGVLQSRRSVQVCGTAETLPQLIDLLHQTWPDVLLLADPIKGSRPADVVTAVRAQWPKLPILLFANVEAAPARYFAALRAGASVQLSTDASPLKLVYLLVQLASPSYVAERSRQFHELGGIPRLTDREAQVLLLVGAGRDGEKAADAMGIPIAVFERHMYHLIRKFGVRDRDEMVWVATQLRNQFFLSA